MAKQPMSDQPAESINRYKIRFLSSSFKYRFRKLVVVRFWRLVSVGAYLASFIVPANLFQPIRPVFIVGCSRSGTTLFCDMLDRAGEFANLSEAGALFELHYYDPEIDHYKDASMVTSFDRRRLRFIFGVYSKLKRKTRILNQHPQNSLRINWLREIFPDAQFIHLVRDGRAVVRSNIGQLTHEKFRREFPYGNFPKPRKWRQYQKLTMVEQYALQWRDIVEYVRSFYNIEVTLPNEKGVNFIEVKYENFCQSPTIVYKELEGFLNMDFVIDAKELSVVSPQNWKWKQDFSHSEQMTLTDIVDELLIDLGYLDEKDVLPLNSSILNP